MSDDNTNDNIVKSIGTDDDFDEVSEPVGPTGPIENPQKAKIYNVTEKEVEIGLDQLKDIGFKMGNLYFRVVSTNSKTSSFTAKLANPILKKKPTPKPQLSQKEKKKKRKKK